MTRIAPLLVVCLWFASPAFAGQFQNLGFEAGTIDHSPPWEFPTAQALPGWTTNNYGVLSGMVLYDTIALDSASISIHDGRPNSIPPLRGTYSMVLQVPSAATIYGGDTPLPLPFDTTISQVGVVPTDARSLHFSTFSPIPAGSDFRLVVSINGNALPAYEDLFFGDYAADVTRFAGQEVSLQFALRLFQPSNSAPWVMLDAIAFSPIVAVPIPEPSTAVLSALGMVGLAAYSLRRKR